MNYSDSYIRGVKAAQNLLERLDWQYDASCFAATAPPEMREEAGRVVFGPRSRCSLYSSRPSTASHAKVWTNSGPNADMAAVYSGVSGMVRITVSGS